MTRRQTVKSWGLIRRVLAMCVMLLAGVCAYGQNIQGTIFDQDDGRTVSGVFISIDEGTLNLQSDEFGEFLIEGLEPGRHVLVFQHVQYNPVYVEVQLGLSRNAELQVQMGMRTVALPEVTVPGATFTQEGILYQITPEEADRYPATFFDPARFAASFPGVQVANDQGNQLVINGLSPDLMQWHLEGLEIVNPNHNTNAGTVNDRPTLTGGGVNMLSNHTLANSMLLTGAMPDLSNATSGLMDMYFRNGSTDQAEHHIQVGLLGVQGATEGPFKKGGRSSYILNARYSTVGLLSLMGVDFGDEQIRFGDVSLSTNFFIGDNGAKLKVFGFFGSNSNVFEAKDSVDWTEDKDRHNINYSAGTDAIGASWSQPISTSSLLTVRSVFSRSNYTRIDDIKDTDNPFSDEEGRANKWASEVRYSTLFADKVRFNGGINFTVDSREFKRLGLDGNYQGDASAFLLRPYLNFKSDLSRSLTLQVGMASTYYENSNTWNFEPDMELAWSLTEGQSLTLRYRLSSQATYTLAFVDTAGQDLRNRELLPIRAHNAQLAYQVALGKGYLEANLFYTRTFNVPVTLIPSDFSALNVAIAPGGKRLISNGNGDSYGVNLAYRKNFTGEWYLSGNVGYVIGNYTGSDGVDRKTSYDIGQTLHVTSGKEWGKTRDYGLRTWGVNAGVIYYGGLREGEIDPVASAANNRTEYVQGTMGNNKLDDYFRVDFRLYWRTDKAKRTSTISLDVQNLVGVKNAWFSNYDLLYKEIRAGEQLGVIPVLNWRLDF